MSSFNRKKLIKELKTKKKKATGPKLAADVSSAAATDSPAPVADAYESVTLPFVEAKQKALRANVHGNFYRPIPPLTLTGSAVPFYSDYYTHHTALTPITSTATNTSTTSPSTAASAPASGIDYAYTDFPDINDAYDFGAIPSAVPLPSIRRNAQPGYSRSSNGAAFSSRFGYNSVGNKPARPISQQIKKSLEEIEMSAELKQDNHEDLLSALKIVPVAGRTYVTAVVFDIKDGSSNVPQLVVCHHGLAFDKGYAYDQGADAYLVNAVDQFDLGYVQLAYQIKMPDCGDWHVQVPLPQSVLKRHFSSLQNKQLLALQDRYADKDRYSIQFMQMSGCDN